MKKRWKVSLQDTKLQQHLSNELKVSPLFAQLLINRGLVDSNEAFSFLSPTLKNLHDPFMMKDMDRSCERLLEALRKKEKVVVYGDYDVDGVTATSLLYIFFKEIGLDVDYFIPERLKEGYALNCNAFKQFAEGGKTLVVTVDCGISNFDEITFAKDKGIDVIVTDHHEIAGSLPPACAILNPKQDGCNFPFKGLAGVGVAFYLTVAFRARLRELDFFSNGIPNLMRYLDLVALGTIADVVPLVDENRILVKFGLEEISKAGRVGMRAIKEVCGIKNGQVKSSQIGFQIAPRINAAGRMGKADRAVRLFVTTDEKEAMELARTLGKENRNRQRIELDTLTEAISMIEAGECASEVYPDDKGIVLDSESWHPGVIGIVASRLAERFNRPAILIAFDGDTGRGSARGVKGVNVLECLKACSGSLERYGGHKAAAGITIKKDAIEAFKRDFHGFLNREVTDEDLVPEIAIDLLVSLDDLNKRVVSEIDNLAPFGCCNAEPVFGIKDTRILETNVVANRHLRLKVKQGDNTWSAIGFGLAGRHPLRGHGFDIAFSPYIDTWKGNEKLAMRIKEL